MQDGEDKHNKYDFDHIVFGREFHMKELIRIMMLTIVVMNEVFEDIENDKRNKRREKNMAGEMLVSITEVKHGFLL